LNDELAIRGTVDDMLRENLPGIEAKSREELEAIVRTVHAEAVALFLKKELTPTDAPRYEWKRIVETLKGRS
jgi:hypothetical protein